jgi:hypothetical protein
MAAQRSGYSYSNQMHSILWELHRRLGRAYKTKENIERAKRAWEAYESGQLSQSDVMQELIRIAEQSGFKFK